MNRVVRDMLRRRRDNAYNNHMDGHYDEEYNKAYEQAYEKGYRHGYDKGYDRAHNEITPYGEHGMTVNDGKRGVKGTGRYGMGGSMYRKDNASEEEIYLTSEDMKKWKEKIGEKFSMPQIEQSMRTMDIKPDMFTPEELCLTANMLYSVFDKTLSRIIPKEKEVNYYTSLAENFLNNKHTNVQGGEKLAAYYYCFVDDEE